MKLLVATIVGIMFLYTLILVVQEWLDARKLQREQDEIKNKYQ